MRTTFPALALLATVLMTAACTTFPHPPAVAAVAAAQDPYLWLEDITGTRSLEWVRERNAASQAVLTAQPEFAPIKARLLEVLNSKDRIAHISRIGAHVYNFWTDDTHVRGLWRRTTLDDFKSSHPRWETVLDVDELGRREKESWVWAGATCLPARTEAAVDRCMVALSRGGSDAVVMREFDLKTHQFVDRGFFLPEAKSSIAWIDRDTVYVETDFGPGSLTRSGYPRLIKRWSRGTPLSDAQSAFEAEVDDVGVDVTIDHSPGVSRHVFTRRVDFHRQQLFVLQDGRLQRLEKPDDASAYFLGDLLLLQLRSPYQVGATRYPAGALLATSFGAFMRAERSFDLLFEPTATRSLGRTGVRLTRSHLLLDVMDNVTSRLVELHRDGGRWVERDMSPLGAGQLRTIPLYDHALADDPLGDVYLMGYEDFLTPDSLFLARAGSDGRQLLKQRPAFFDAQGMRVEQLFATSRDGTRVPYYVVWPKGAGATGDNPTLLYGYGGFQISLRPAYSPGVGNAWIARGGVYVVANIRGGGEFGPAWHRAGIRENKQRSYDDFIAVAEDLMARRITSPRHLGIMGGSNGGLLVGAVLTQRPDLFNAAVSQVPLLDMQRFHKLLAGASWIAEYGDPDREEDWAFISAYSPYQRVRADLKYPRAFFITSTRDDRVHPGHARKMVARMQSLGHDVLYYENTEGGHGGAADAQQRAHLQALEFGYLWMQLGRDR